VTRINIRKLSQLVRFSVYSPDISIKVVFPLENLTLPS
jgi:hypothetical protein